jgi:hypothetical protein
MSKERDTWEDNLGEMPRKVQHRERDVKEDTIQAKEKA